MAAELAAQMRGVVKRFGADVVALDGLDLSIATGETYGLPGSNGAGKTTSLRTPGEEGLLRDSATFSVIAVERPAVRAKLTARLAGPAA